MAVDIFVIDGSDVPNPEDNAMLQALYSRSPKSVVEHLEKVRKVGSSNMMATYYVGYRHRSIGDCGFTTIFIENCSLLAAKAIQDHPLYCGQEASTRYLDMAKRPMVDPLRFTGTLGEGNKEAAAIQSAWMSLYDKALDAVVPALKEEHPQEADQDAKTWEKAIKARAFDICRSLLPAGVTTFVSWTVNLRQADDHLKELRHHPLAEVRGIASRIHAKLSERYPSSFSHKRDEAEEQYLAKSMKRFGLWNDDDGYDASASFVNPCVDRFSIEELGSEEWDLLRTRPRKAELHQRFRQYGNFWFYFPLDFGSYRDLQRQRSCVQEMPLLTLRYGFHDWYRRNLPVWVMDEVEKLEARVHALQGSEEERQYYIPLGYLVSCKVVASLPSAVYIAELRSGLTVHPTLREVAQKMGRALKAQLPEMALYVDESPDTWTLKRGKQDIVEKTA